MRPTSGWIRFRVGRTHYSVRVTLRAGDPPKGLFVAFEGGDGTGKSTQISLLAEHLRSGGRDVLVTREPGDSRIGPQVRDIVLHGGEIDARAEALLFAADRADHVAATIRPALERGSAVLVDRYIDSSVAYQGVGRGLGIGPVRALSEFATQGLLPHLTVVLDLDPALARRRVDGRHDADRIEREPDGLHERVRQAFLDLASSAPQRYLVVDAQRPAAAIAAEVAAAVAVLT